MIDAEWVTKAEAAALLQTSTRTIERHAEAGRIETRRAQRQGKSPETLFRKTDIERLQPQTFLMPASSAIAPQATPPNHPAEIQLLTAIATALGTITTPATATACKPPKPWLTLDEASDLCGLGRRLIRSLINSKAITAVKDGRSWKISRASLMHWTPETQPIHHSPSPPSTTEST